MPQSPRQSGDDERIDDYVCGRLTPEEQLEFEAEFIGNHELVKRIEEAYALQQCLVEAKKQNAFHKYTGVSWLEKYWRYLAVPQTMCGAIVAAFLLTPVFALVHKNALIEADNILWIPQSKQDEEVERSVRKVATAEYEATLGDGNVRFAFELVVPSTQGNPVPWDVELVDRDNRVVWHKSNLRRGASSGVTIVVPSDVFTVGFYTYKISSKEKGLVGSGSIQIKGGDK